MKTVLSALFFAAMSSAALAADDIINMNISDADLSAAYEACSPGRVVTLDTTMQHRILPGQAVATGSAVTYKDDAQHTFANCPSIDAAIQARASAQRSASVKSAIDAVASKVAK